MNKTVLDERELQTLHRIGYRCMWIGMLLQCAVLVVQLLLGCSLREMAGVLVSFAGMGLSALVLYAAAGIWDSRSRASTGGNLLCAFAGALAVTAGVLVIRRRILVALIAGAAMFAVCFGLLTLMMRWLRARQAREDALLED